MGIGLTKQIFGLVDLVRGIHGDQNSADLGGSPEGQKPLGHVGGPDGHLGTGFDAKRNKSPGKFVHVVAELAVGTGVVQRGVFDGQLVGEGFHHGIQYLGEGLVDQCALFPYIASYVAVAPVKMLFAALGI